MNTRGPGNLGRASGSIDIDTSGLGRAEARSRAAGQNISRNLGRVNQGARQAQTGIQGLSSSLNQLAGIVGIGFGVAGAAQLLRMAAASTQAATQFQRQEIAARNLAGSQEELNRLLRAYEEATGGAISRAQSLADVTRLQAVGLANSAEELERFVQASRGAALATGRDLDYITQQIQLTIANQSTMRLDQIGLGVTEVNQRAEELRSSTRDLTEELAFQEAVLSLLLEKYGDAAAQMEPSGVEEARGAWSDLNLAVGEFLTTIDTPIGSTLAQGINEATEALQGMTTWTDNQIDSLNEWIDRSRVAQGVTVGLINTLALLPGPVGGMSRLAMRTQLRNFRENRPTPPMGPNMVPPGAGTPAGGVSGSGLSDEAEAAVVDWAQERERIERDTGNRINEVTREYNQQRADTISDFEQQIAREAQDFARQRQRQEQDLARRIADVHEERARREAQAAEDLAERIADAQTESADRIADWERDRNERVANVRAESNERLQELEEDYAREREQALRDHRNNILSAAGRLDARALHEEQRRFARQEQEAAESHEERISDEREAEQERIREINEMHRERVAQERETLDETIRQAKEAHEERLQDAREADRRRVEDMRESFELQKAREDEDRAIRLQRLKQDHNDQLDEQDRQHGLRIDQIERQGQEERTALDLEFQEQLIELKGKSKQLLQHQKDLRDDAMELFDEFWEHVNETIGPQEAFPSLADPRPRGFAHGGAVNSTGLAMLHAGEYVLNPGITSQLRNMLGNVSQPGLVGAVAAGAGGGRALSVGDISIQVTTAPGEGQLAGEMVRAELAAFFQEMAE